MADAKHLAGRALMFDDLEALERKIDEYFASRMTTRTVVDKHGNTVTETVLLPAHLTGLARALDCSTETLRAYGHKEKYSATIARARQRCAEFAHDQLYIGNDRGAKFDLINNYGWVDRTEVNTTLTIDSADAIAQARDRARLLATERLAQIPCGSAANEPSNDYIEAEIDDNTD